MKAYAAVDSAIRDALSSGCDSIPAVAAAIGKSKTYTGWRVRVLIDRGDIEATYRFSRIDRVKLKAKEGEGE